MAEKKDPQLTEHLDRQGPGAYLRNAREEADMSLDAVAKMLLLSPNTLKLLEADAHERLPAPTFVRGYLRGYARVLGLPSGPILDMYNRQGFEPPPLNNDATEPTQAHTSDIPVRLVTYAVAVALALFVGLWWHNQQGGGFGIGGNLFGWSPGSDQDSSSLTAEESVMSPEEADANEPSIAMTSEVMTSDPAEELPQDDESNVPPRAGESDPVPTDLGPTGPGPEGAVVAMPSFEPVAPPGDLESLFAPSFGGIPSGEGDTPEAAPAGTEAEGATVTARSPGADTAPGSGESAGPSPALPATTDDTPPAEAPPGGAPAAVDGEALATQEVQLEAIAGIDRGADPAVDPAVEDGSVPIPEEIGAADSADGATGAAVADAAAMETERADPDAPVGSTITATAAQSGLVLEFAHESWVEVYDRELARLYFNLVQPGRVLSFDGPRPFDVLLGYSKDVQVTIDGRAFDIAPFTRYGVARFSIGSESAGEVAGGISGADPGGATVPDASESPAEPVPVPDR